LKEEAKKTGTKLSMDLLRRKVKKIWKFSILGLREVLFQFLFSLWISIFCIIHVHIYKDRNWKGKKKLKKNFKEPYFSYKISYRLLIIKIDK
jgi:hypothetical protein